VNLQPHEAGVVRAFVAVELPADLLKALNRVQAELRGRGVHARWTRAENLHLTLKFLGPLPAGRLRAVMDAMQAAAAEYAAFELTAAGIGVFPGTRRARVLWVGFTEPDPVLTRLHRSLDERLGEIGFAREGRDFQGHLTLGRFSTIPPDGLIAELVSAYASERFGSFKVREVVLFESDLRPTGPVYTALGKAPLRDPRQNCTALAPRSQIRDPNSCGPRWEDVPP
jgi:2'-5' RNA ligase